MSVLPVELAHQLPTCPEDRRWLIDGLWADQGVGIVGGEPKCCKSFLALDMAVAVASGGACLRRFRSAQAGRVLLFAAEDALHVVRRRLDGICHAANVALAALDLQVITAPTVRLDVAGDRERLTDTIAALKPRLLVLDPFVRLHRIDENTAAEVAPLLAYLRELQRRFQLAVVVVHHARKGAGKARDGQALRGSSEFHAWGDSNLYLRRAGDQLTLAIEQRAAASSGGIPLLLHVDGCHVSLAVATPAPVAAVPEPLSPAQKVEQVLGQSTHPLPLGALRKLCSMRAATLGDVLADLTQRGRVRKTAAGYQAANR